MFVCGTLPTLTSFLSHVGLFACLLTCLQSGVGLLLDFLEDVVVSFFSYFEAIFTEVCLSL